MLAPPTRPVADRTAWSFIALDVNGVINGKGNKGLAEYGPASAWHDADYVPPAHFGVLQELYNCGFVPFPFSRHDSVGSERGRIPEGLRNIRRSMARNLEVAPGVYADPRAPHPRIDTLIDPLGFDSTGRRVVPEHALAAYGFCIALAECSGPEEKAAWCLARNVIVAIGDRADTCRCYEEAGIVAYHVREHVGNYSDNSKRYKDAYASLLESSASVHSSARLTHRSSLSFAEAVNRFVGDFRTTRFFDKLNALERIRGQRATGQTEAERGVTSIRNCR